MLHRPFGKIPARASGVFPGGPWVATEKVHGAQLVVAVDTATGEGRIGKRKAWLEPADVFFGWQLLAPELLAAVREWAEALEVTQLHAYGELYGGAYPHPDVTALPGLQAVQTGVWYHPGLRWSPFDLLLCAGDDDEGVFASYSELAALSEEGPFLPPPLVARGSRADLLALPVASPTRLPARASLPPLADNIAEGLVLRPDRRMAPGDRSLLKRKIPTFDDACFDEATPWAPGVLSEPALRDWAARLVGPARVASARSKVGTDATAVADEVALDVMVDLSELFDESWRALSDEGREGVEAHIRATLEALLASPA
ncbi:MAG: RNA ligase family protein [Polyangiales bacterium]